MSVLDWQMMVLLSSELLHLFGVAFLSMAPKQQSFSTELMGGQRHGPLSERLLWALPFKRDEQRLSVVATPVYKEGRIL